MARRRAVRPRGGGDLESAVGWQLKGGAKLVAGNEPFFVHSRSDARSLSLPAGSSATTPFTCIGLLHPTLRFFAVNTGSPLSSLQVEVLVRTASGSTRAVPVGVVLAGGSWGPTLPLPLLVNFVEPLVTLDGAAEVAFRFTPRSALLTAGKWRIDDVYVDPWQNRG